MYRLIGQSPAVSLLSLGTEGIFDAKLSELGVAQKGLKGTVVSGGIPKCLYYSLSYYFYHSVSYL